MFTGELLTRWLAFSENINSSTAAPGDVGRRRLRGAQEAQEVVDEIWGEDHWSFKRKGTTISIPADSYEAPVPADFDGIPAEGGIYSGSTRLVDLQGGPVTDMQKGTITHTAQSFFTAFGYSVSSNRRMFQFNFQGVQDLTLYYNRKPPLLVDMPLTAITLAAGSALAGMPSVSTNYAVSYPGVDGYENEIGATVAIVPGANRVVITAIPQPGNTGEHNAASIKVWRGPNDGTGIMRLLATLALGTTTYTDTTTDAAWAALPLLVNQSSLEQIPAAYHQTVVMAGLRARTKKTKGDTRDWKMEYLHGLAKMKVKEIQRKSSVQSLPRSVPAGNW